MANIRIKRGLAANVGNITPLLGEPVYLTDTKKIRFGDGSTAGGLELAYIGTEKIGAALGVASLGADQKIPTSQLPALAISDVSTANDETEQLGLDAQEGDTCIRVDLNKTFIHNGGTADDMTDWSEMLTPTEAVSSVNGKTGNVSLGVNDLTDVDTNTTAPTNNDVLSWDGTNWVPIATNTVGRTNFAELDDTPENFTGSGNKIVKVNSGESALEFADNSLENLSDSNITSISDGDYIKWDNATSKWVNSSPEVLSLDDISDVDTTTAAPTNGQTLKWNGTNWVPADDESNISSLDNISDVNVTNVTDGQIISWDDAAGEWQSTDLPTGVDGTFKGLTDTPNAYTSGDAGKFLKVNAAEDAIEFTTTGINELSDVDTVSSAPADGEVLSWDNANSKWVPADIDGGTF